jgi:hypothetical protein
MISRKNTLKIFLILALLVGTTAGIVLTQKRQDIRERAMVCWPGFECPTPKPTSTPKPCLSPYVCRKYDCPDGYTRRGEYYCTITDSVCCEPPTTPTLTLIPTLTPKPTPKPSPTKTSTPKPPQPTTSPAPTTPPRTPSPTSTPIVGKITLLFRQQGITTSPTSGIAEQLNTYITLKSNGGVTYKIEGIKPAVGSSGIWTASFSQDSQGRFIPAGTYDILIKGVSHLQKKFTSIQISNNQQNKIDKSTNTKDELKAGDTNNDNSITIEDISTVLKFYTDFKVPVNKNDLTMIQSDINKDGFITIDDVALVALNWSDFVVKGDE